MVVAPPTYNIVDELKEEGDWGILQKYAGFEFDDTAPKTEARTKYDNIMYLERPGCNLCMGNQEKAEKGDTVMATSTRLFQGRVVEDSDERKEEILHLDAGRRPLDDLEPHPDIDEYKAAFEVDLTSFARRQQSKGPRQQGDDLTFGSLCPKGGRYFFGPCVPSIRLAAIAAGFFQILDALGLPENPQVDVPNSGRLRWRVFVRAGDELGMAPGVHLPHRESCPSSHSDRFGTETSGGSVRI